MSITFDPINKYILLPDPSPSYTIAAQSIYNDAMDWHDTQGAMDDDPPMRSGGYSNLGGGAYSDKIFVLQKGWKLKPFSGTYTLTVTGTLIALDDNDNPYDRRVPPDSGTVQWVFQVSSQGIVIPDVAEWSQIEKDGVISDVDAIQAKTINLPTDPSSQSQVALEVDDLITRSKGLDETHDDLATHDADIKGPLWTDESLKEIKEVVDDIKASGVGSGTPKSKAQYLESII